MRVQAIVLALVAVLGLASLAPTQQSSGLSVKKEQGALAFYSGSSLITKFDYTNYTRPIFYPMLSPAGAKLTRSYPMEKVPGETADHPHHKSAWFNHGDVIAEGITPTKKAKGIEGTDFWADTATTGKQQVSSVEVKQASSDVIVVVAKIEWIDADGKKVMDETRTIRVHKVEGAYLISVESDLFGSVTNIVFGDTKEGSFGIRINDFINGKSGKGTIQNAEGKKGEKACWGYPSDWCDYSGPLDGKTAGIAILADPKNPYPTCWHVREYGLMAANPFGREHSGFPTMKGKKDLVRLEKGQHLKLRYAYLLHDGDATSGHVAEAFRRFVALRGEQ